MNRHLLIALDKTLFRVLFVVVVLLAKLRPPAREVTVSLGSGAMRALVIRPGGLGDAIMSLAFVRALRRSFPHVQVTIVCVRKNATVFQAAQLHDELIVLDDLPRLLGAARSLRRRRFDVVFDLEPFRRISAVVGWLTGARVRVGFDTNSRRELYTNLVSYSGDGRFESDNMLRQLRAVGCEPGPACAQDLSLAPDAGARANARQLLESAGVDPQAHFLVAVAVGALKPHHRWVMSEFAALIGLVKADDPRVRVVLVGSGADRADAREVVERLDDAASVIDLVGRTDLAAVLGVLEHCPILIACDGGMVYLGAAAGCSTVSLWGPGVMERFKPPGEDHVGVRKGYACVPCVTWDRLGEFPPCPYDRRCYKDLRATEVFDAYLRLKARSSGLRSPSG